MEHLTPLGGRVRRFTALNPEARLAYLRGWSMAYSDPATRTLTRFPGAWPERVKIAAYPVDFGDIA
jgi:hypothetical protein